MAHPARPVVRSYTATLNSSGGSARPSTAMTTATASARPPPGIPVSNAPSNAYRANTRSRRHRSTAARSGHGRIDSGQFSAACRWRQWFEVMNRTKTSTLQPRVDVSVGNNGGVTDHRIDADGKLRAAGAALGSDRVTLLHLHIVEDMAWRRLAVTSSTLRTRTPVGVEVGSNLLFERHGKPPIAR